MLKRRKPIEHFKRGGKSHKIYRKSIKVSKESRVYIHHKIKASKDTKSFLPASKYQKIKTSKDDHLAKYIYL